MRRSGSPTADRSPSRVRGLPPPAIAALLAALVLAACAGRSGARDDTAPDSDRLPPGDHEIGLVHDGLERSYLVHVPDAAGPLPVVLAFHGGGGNARQFRETSGFDALANRHGFVSVHPNGTGGIAGRLLTWNAGGCCGPAMDGDVDDVGFVLALVEDLAGRLPIDRGRLYATGHSNGAMMAYRLGAEAASTFAAIAPVAGAMSLEEFHPTEPLSVLHIHSIDDPRALYDGGVGPPFPGTNRRSRHEPVEAGIERWVEHDGCPAEPRVAGSLTGDPLGADAGQTVTRLVYGPCREGVQVGLLRLEGVGHGWPGERLTLRRERTLGPSTTLIDAAEEVWAFVSGFSRMP